MRPVRGPNFAFMRLNIYFPEDNPSAHDVSETPLTVGRLSDNVVLLDEGSVSGHHGEVVLADGVPLVRDLGSTNGTFVNGEPVTEAVLADGDEIHFGKIRCTFSTTPVVPEPAVEAAAVSLPEAVGGAGGRPANFRPLSPFPHGGQPRDTAGLVAWSLAGLALLAFLAAVAGILSA